MIYDFAIKNKPILKWNILRKLSKSNLNKEITSMRQFAIKEIEKYLFSFDTEIEELFFSDVYLKEKKMKFSSN